MKTQNRVAQQRQRGMALITAMLLLLVVTIMALSMFRSYGVQERLAGNTRDKQRAINAAIAAQQYAESLLASGAAPATGVCPAGLLPSTNGGQVCSVTAPLPDFTQVPWTSGNVYTQFTSNQINNVSNVILSAGTADQSGQSASYVQAPAFYITDLGINAGSPPGEVYQVDALGYGGTASTIAVVESTFVIGTNTPQDKTQP
jgi:type IV pilus assembly protein PilX